jgi:rhodanese-related sulfurtransferase
MKPRNNPQRLYAWDLAHKVFSEHETPPLLVCADPNPKKCLTMQTAPSISFPEFTSRLDSIPKDREIIFYCESALDSAAAERASEYLEKGYSRAGSLDGGIEAWNTITGFLPNRR